MIWARLRALKGTADNCGHAAIGMRRRNIIKALMSFPYHHYSGLSVTHLTRGNFSNGTNRLPMNTNSVESYQEMSSMRKKRSLKRDSDSKYLVS